MIPRPRTPLETSNADLNTAALRASVNRLADAGRDHRADGRDGLALFDAVAVDAIAELDRLTAGQLSLTPGYAAALLTAAVCELSATPAKIGAPG